MENITTTTRRPAYDGIQATRGDRCRTILDTLGSREMTVEDIADELVKKGIVKYFDRNFVAPRLTELKQAGIVTVVDERTSRRSGRKIAVWAIVERK